MQRQLQKIKQLTALAAERLADYQRLFQLHAVSRHALLEKQQQYVELSSERDTQHSRLQEIYALQAKQQQELLAHQADFRQTTLDSLRQAEQTMRQTGEELRKTALRQQRSQIRSPVDGTVQQLAVHTLGGVVTEAQTLMRIVPEQDVLVAEVTIQNQDIGFIHPGQPVAIKVDSFPYTRYGMLEGVLKSVSQDAVAENESGAAWVFPGQIQLKQDYLSINGKPTRLAAGMTVTAEIKTGQRRLISYFLSPLQRYAHESLQER